MDGLFDDLIPSASKPAAAPAPGGLFDDLIPAKPAPSPTIVSGGDMGTDNGLTLDTGLNVPEKPATIAAQQAQVAGGRKPAVMFPEGSQEPDLPEDWSRIKTPRGIFHYDPSQVKASKIRELSALGRENELLGLGPVSKPEADKRIAAGEPPVVVAERQPDGTEVKAAVGTPSTMEAQRAALEASKTPGNMVGVESPVETVTGRLPAEGPMPPPRPIDAGTPAQGLDVDPAALEAWRNTRQKNADGTTFGMLTPAEGEKEMAARIAGAEQGLAEADARWNVAQQRAAQFADQPMPRRGSSGAVQRLMIESELQSATDARIEARKGLDAARGTPAPQETALRSGMERGARALLDMPTMLTGAVGRPIDAVFGTEIGKGAQAETDRTAKAFPGDVARQDEFGQKLAEGAGSMVSFVIGGAAARSLGLSAQAGAMALGSGQSAEQMYREADKIGATGMQKAMAYVSGLGIGATEGFGIGRVLDEMDKKTGGGVKRYFGLVLKQTGEEGLQEGTQTLLENVAKLGVLGIDPGHITKDVATNALVGALLGAGTAGTLGAPGALAGKGVDGQLPAPGEPAALDPALTPPPVPAVPDPVMGNPIADQTPPAAADVTAPAAAPAIPVTEQDQPVAQAIEPATPDLAAEPTAPAPTDIGIPTSESAALPETPAQVDAALMDEPTNRILRAAGYSDEDLADMAPAQRAEALATAAEEGITDPGASAEPQVAPPIPPVPENAGTRAAPVRVASEADMEPVRAQVNTDPTEAQKEAGNYKHGHAKFEDFHVTIENPKGSTRTGTDTDGETWQSVLPADYGYIKRTKGRDGDHVDAYIGPKPANGRAFVVEQIDPKTGKLDELKVIMGVDSAAEARAIYEGAFSDGSGASRIGDLVPMTTADLKTWLDAGGGKGRVPKKFRGKAEGSTAEAPNPVGQPADNSGNASLTEAPAAAPNSPANADQRTEIGTNADGYPLYEDARGVRSFVRDGVRVTEKVGIVPTREGGVAIEKKAREDRFEPVAEKKPAAPRPSRAGPVSMVRFLQKAGGIKDESGELRARNLSRQFPGLVNNKAGMTLDRAREMVAEAGYLTSRDGVSDGMTAAGAAVASTTINDFLDALDAHPVYSQRDAGDMAERAGAQRDKQREQREQRDEDEAAGQIKDDLLAAGLSENMIDADILALAAKMTIRGDVEWQNAYEAAVMDEMRRDPDARKKDSADDVEIEWHRLEQSPFDEESAAPAGADARSDQEADAPRAREQQPAEEGEVSADGARADGDGAPAQDQERGRYGEEPEGLLTETPGQTALGKEQGWRRADEIGSMLMAIQTGGMVPGEKSLAFLRDNDLATGTKKAWATGQSLRLTEKGQRARDEWKGYKKPYGPFLAELSGDTARAPEPTTEKGADDKPQTVIPGAERIGQGEQAQRKADEPLKPKAPQKDAGGMFGDSMDQADLMDVLAKPAPKKDDEPSDAYKAAMDVFRKASEDFTKVRDAYVKTHDIGDAEFMEGQKKFDAAKAAVDRAEAIEQGKAPADEPAKRAPAADSAVVEAFRNHFSESGRFATIVEARKFARENGFEPVEGAPENKQIEEMIEHALVLAARDIIAESKGRGIGTTYDRLVDLYARQPKLGSRTSASVAEQAYSTPMPLAYLASRLAGIDADTTVFEPSAGNGALLMEASPANATANELNAIRRANLKSQGFKTTGNDATDPAQAGVLRKQDGGMDVVIANPPFGAVREGGESKVWKVGPFSTTNIDHAISMVALDAMRDDGRAVLIIGGIKAESEAERAKGYIASAKRKFFFRLMDSYNVVDHFTVDGGLYERQGAGWPVDVIVIEGRKKSARKPPSAEVPPLFKSWDALREKINGIVDRAPANIEGPAREPVGEAAVTRGRPESDDGVGGTPAGTGRAVVEPAGRAVEPERLGGSPDLGELGSARELVSVADREGSGPQLVAERGATDPRVDPDGGRSLEPNAAGQVAYAPASRRGVSLGTLVPANLRTTTQESLDRVQATRGNIDTYVASELGYKAEELGKYFSAEQVDALALAIDNIAKGAGFIIGDQTGIGKGRVVAGAIRYAHRKGMVPVFATEKPDLYGDMWRDLHDIGFDEYLGRPIEMFMTNSGTRVPLDEEAVSWVAEREVAIASGEEAPPRRGQFSSSQTPATASKRMSEIISGSFKPDVVFTTYDQANSVRGNETDRRQFLRTIAPNAFLILDEAHNAGGQGDDARVNPEKAPPRAKVFREAVQGARAVLYSSATYAKSPKVMDLFIRTDMAKAVESPAQLAGLIERGGVPLQQAVSAMLAKSGQYMRRERSFEGVSYDPETVPVDEAVYGNFTNALRSIFEFDRRFEEERMEIADKLAMELGAGTARDGGVGEGGASATQFSSIMHNIINQMILSIKARGAAERAIQALKAGERPVITLSSTMESFITDYTDNAGLSVGDQIDVDFGDVLARYLERTRRITIKMPDDTKRHVMIPLTDMDTSMQDQYHAAERTIREMDFSGLPISPIDWIRAKVEEAGYTIREVTGRATMIDYQGNAPHLRARPRNELGSSGKRVTIQAFNKGDVDAVILNKSGSTGVSLHASAKVKDQRKRRMIIVQADANIDTHMQMLGRVHRTGQVIVPAYTQLMADIPAEVRPAAVLMKKMASLNANTTASRKSAFTGDSVDFMNDYGDIVVATILGDDPDLNARLGHALKFQDGKPAIPGAAARATGRLTLLTPMQQQEFIDEISRKYVALIEQLTATGENKLEARSVDLAATPIEKTVIKASEGPSPFQAEVTLEKVSAKSQGRAMKPADVVGTITDELGVNLDNVRPANNFAAAMRSLAAEGRKRAYAVRDLRRKEAEAFAKDETRGMKDLAAKEKADNRNAANIDRWSNLLITLHPGGVISYETESGGGNAVVLSVSRSGKAKNPAALSAWDVTLALPDSARSMIVPFSQIAINGEEAEGKIAVSASYVDLNQLEKDFTEANREGRETRYLVTGNMLAGFDQTKGSGQIVNYTMDDGSIRQGILMGRKFDPAKFFNERGVRFKTGAQVLEFIRKAPQGEVTSTDEVVTIRAAATPGVFEFDMPAAKAKGGRYYADATVRSIYDLWERKGSRMRGLITSQEKSERLIEAMMKLDAVFETVENQDIAQAILDSGRAPAPVARATEGDDSGIDPQLAADVERMAREVVGRVAPWAAVNVQQELRAPDGLSNASEGQRIAGQYWPTVAIIDIALTPHDRLNTVHHEAFHALQDAGVIRPDELDLMDREAPRLRALLARGYGAATVERWSMSELTAGAYGHYAAAKDRGQSVSDLHIGVRRVLERFYEIFRQIRNYLAGRGFQTTEDIFERARSGQMAQRESYTPSLLESPAYAQEAAPFAAPLRLAENDERTRMSRVIAYTADAFVRLKELQEKFGRDANAANTTDAYRALSALNTRISERVTDMRDDELSPMLALVQEAGGVERVDRFMYAQHAEERNDYIATINPGLQDGGSGMMTADARAKLATFQQAADYPALQRAAAAVRAMLDRDLTEREAGNLMSAQETANLRAMFQNYVPLKGFEGNEYLEGGGGGGVGVSVTKREIKTVMGRRSMADSIIAQTIGARIEGIQRVQKNRVDLALLRLGQQMQAHYGPDTPIKVSSKLPMKQVRSGNQVVSVVDQEYPSRPDVVMAKIAGKPRYIELRGEPELADALKNAAFFENDAPIEAWGTATRIFGHMWTVYNPMFPPVNFVRDFLDASTGARALIGEAGTRTYMKSIPRGMAESIRAMFGRETPAFRQFRLDGGRMSFAKLRTMDQIKTEVERQVDGAPAWKRPFIMANFLMEKWNDVFENAHRFALYHAALTQGLPRAQAASAALEGTMNFHRRGYGGGVKIGRMIFPFLNPTLQAPLRASRLIKEAGGLASAQGAKMAGAAVIKGLTKTYMAGIPIGMAIGMLNYALGGDDDDQTPWWDKAQADPRNDKNIMVYVGGKDAQGRPNVALIPAFPEIMLPIKMGHALASMFMGKRSLSDVGKSLGHAVYALSPTEGRGVVPSILAPFNEIITNRNAFGRSIHQEDRPNTKGVPNAEQMFASTAPAWQTVARALGAATMGTETKPGVVNLHPEDVRHLARSFAGGWYQIVEQIASSTGMSEPDERVAIGARRFYARGADVHQTYDRKKFDDATNEANARRASIARGVDIPNATQREQRANRVENREQIEAKGGRLGPRGGVTVPEAEVTDTARAIISSLFKQRDRVAGMAIDAKAKEERKAAINNQITETRRTYSRMADDVKTGKVAFENIAGELKAARLRARRGIESP